MIRLLDLPGLPAIEARVRLNALTATRQDWELEHMVEAFIVDVLGVHGRPEDILWDHGYRSAVFIEDDDDADNDDENIIDIDLGRRTAGIS